MFAELVSVCHIWTQQYSLLYDGWWQNFPEQVCDCWKEYIQFQ